MGKVFFGIAMLFVSFTVEAQQGNLPAIENVSGDVPGWMRAIPRGDGKLYGVGVGDLSAVEASCELAKFQAQTDLSRQIYTHFKTDTHTVTNPTAKEREILDKLNFYRQEFNLAMSLIASLRTAYELSPYVTVERRTKTSDGCIWYLVSAPESVIGRLEDKIGDYTERFLGSTPEYE